MAANLIPTEGGSPIAIDKPIMLIGRNQSCDISLQTSSKVSRRHCCIVQCGRKFLLRDLGSMNGVRVNAHRIVEIELQPEDHVAIADVQFTFRVDEPQKDAARLKQKAPQGLPADEQSSMADKSVADKEECPGSLQDVPDPELGSNTFSDDDLPGISAGEIRLKDDSQSRPEFVKT